MPTRSGKTVVHYTTDIWGRELILLSFLSGIEEDHRIGPSTTIQRFYRVYLKQKQRSSSMLAFAMGMHFRLGRDSQVAGLDEDILTVINSII